MLTHRRWESLSNADFGWLPAKHHITVFDGGNPDHEPVGNLGVWNDDEIAVGGEFPFHGHKDMEIITYVRQGVLAHRDTLGSEGLIHAGDVQVMSAGTGIRHAEFNKGDAPLKLYQIWLQPRTVGGAPQWKTRQFPKDDRSGRFVVLASGFPDDEGALPVRADARVLAATLKAGEHIHHVLASSRSAYLVLASGRVAVNGEPMNAFDGVAITHATNVEIVAFEDSELVMVHTG
jgi:quercetin 2,3-dioxygenase